MPSRRVRVDNDNRPVADEPAPTEADPASEATCDCPVLEPSEWNEVESDWSDIAFLRTNVGALFGVPVGYPGLLGRAKADAAGAGLEVPPGAMVLMGQGRFRRPVLVEVEGESDARSVVHPGGLAFSVLAEAPFGEMGKRFDEAREKARERYGREPDAMWTWYLTCRECSAERNFETLFVAHYRAPR